MTEEKCVRPSWDQYFLDIVNVVGERGSCDRGRAGCVIVREKRILATGYVGSPAGTVPVSYTHLTLPTN